MLNPVGLFLLLLVQGGEGVFTVGPAVNFGKIANVESDVEIPKDMVFNIRFDSGRSSPRLKVNSTFDSAARFINLKRAADCLLYTSPSPRDQRGSRMPSSA